METKLLPSAKINPTKLLGGSFASPKNPVEDLNPESINVSKSDLLIIKKRVFEIKDLVTSINTLKKKRTNVERKEKEKEKFDKTEKELESKKKPEDKKVKLPSAPKLGFLDIIKRFVVNVLIGFVAVRLIKYLPKLIEVAKFAGGVLDFVTDVGGKLLNGLATFIDVGYKVYDATRGFIKNLGGENFAKGFDKFIGAIDTALFLTTALAASLAIDAVSGDDGPGIMDLFGKKGAAKAVKTTAKVAKLGAAGAAAVVAGVGLLSSALGEGAFQLKKIGNKKVESAKKALDDEKNPFMKPVRWGGYQLARFLNFSLGNIGVLLDIVGTPFRYAIELIRYPFLSEEDKDKQAQNLAKFDARIREQIREGLNVLTLGTAFKEKGSFGNIFGNQGAQTEMMSKMSGGGRPVTRGGKVDSGPKRRITKSKAKRTIQVQPTQLKPGADVGGEEKIEKIFPKSKDKNEVSPLGYIEKTYENTNQDRLFGPLLNLQTKSLVGQKPNKVDYKNAAQGLSNWMTLTFSDEILRTGGVYAAGGGEINVDTMSNKTDDLVNIVAKSLEDNISRKVDAAINDLMRQMMLKDIKPEVKGPGDPGDGGGDLETAGGAVAASELYKRIGADAEQWDIYRNSVALIESGGRYSAMGGSGKHYDGRYQMGEAAKKDGSKIAGVSYPGHSSDPNAHVRVSFRNNPQLQETIFTGFTIANHNYLMRNGKYSSASVERKLEVLGYAHNQGMGGAENWLNTGQVGADGFGTKGTKYTDLIAKNFRAKKSGGRMELASGSIPVPAEVAGVGLQDLKADRKDKKIYLHWNAGSPSSAPTNYHTSILGSGEIRRVTPYNNDRVPHTYRRNSNAIGISVSGMAGASPNNFGSYAIKPLQYQKMAEEVAQVAKSMGWTSGNININNVMTHAEAGSNKDGTRPHDNYGPRAWGGTGERWDLLKLYQGDRDGTGGDKIRGMIKQKMGSRFHGGFIFKDGKYNLHAGEFVVDKDSVDQVGVPFLATINSIENKTQLKQKIVPLIEHLEQFADYEEDYGENNEIEIVIEYPEPIIIKRQIFSNNINYMVSGGSSIDYTQSLMSHA